MFSRYLSRLCLIALLSLGSSGQESQHGTERRNLGLEGPVRSLLTTVVRPNPDPRPQAGRKLMVEANPDWAVFDTQGRRIEFASASSRDRVEVIDKRSLQPDGTEICIDSTGRRQESRKQETVMADGSRELTYFSGSKVVSREVISAVASRTYDGNGRLTSEFATLLNGDDDSKIYDENGRLALHEQTRVSDSHSRFDRWSYDSEGQLVWHLGLNKDGEILSYWCRTGYKPKLSSSDSLGLCRIGLCTSYKFDEQGSGRIERTIQHTSGEGNIEPDSEEHYNFDGILDEKVEIKYTRDAHGNWISRSVFVWDASSNLMIEVERDTRTIEYDR
jgi:hypothetical protein